MVLSRARRRLVTRGIEPWPHGPAPSEVPNILFLTSGSDDYVSDGLLHGLRTLLGDRVTDWPRADQLYAGEPEAHRAVRYGRGFTLYGGLLEDLPIDRTWITERLAGGVFDVVILGDVTRRGGMLVELLRAMPAATKLAVIDGADTPKLGQHALRSLLAPGGFGAPRALRHADFYFKREITPLTARSRAYGLLPEALAERLVPTADILPVAISIPAHLIVDDAAGPRTQRFQTHIVDPEVAALEGRTVEKPFTSEADYRADLERSRFGITTKREGWDAMRHYEIAAAGAIPCFRDLEAKPAACAPHGLRDGVNCISYRDPSELLARIAALTPEEEAALRAGALAWVRDHTTVAEAQRLLQRLGVAATEPVTPMPAPLRHVALNATFLDPGVSGGPESYIRGLIPALAAERPEIRWSVLTSRRGAAGLRASGWQDFAEIVAMPCDEGERARRLLTETVGISRWVRRHRPDVLHSLANLGPPRPIAARHVLTLHDLTFVRVQTFSFATTQVMRMLALGSARHATRIITATEASRREIVELGGVDDRIIDVVPHGRRLPVTPPAVMVDDLRIRLDLEGHRVVVNVAAKRPHKNQALLVRALEHLPQDIVVVLAGHAEPYAEEVAQIARELGVENRLRIPDYLDDAELEALWQLADAAAFPTRGEGFGLPVIEALDRGLPVACSDLDVLTEVSGGLAHPFGVDDPAGAAQAILAALDEPSDRADARHAHAAAYTWERAARRTLDTYERAVGTP